MRGRERPSIGELLNQDADAGTRPIEAFMDTRWQMVLQMVADLLRLRGEEATSSPLGFCEVARAIQM